MGLGVGVGVGLRIEGALDLDVAAVGALLRRAVAEVLEGPVRRAAGARPRALGVLGVRAAELVHEAGDDAVEVDALVEACEDAGGRAHSASGALQPSPVLPAHGVVSARWRWWVG